MNHAPFMCDGVWMYDVRGVQMLQSSEGQLADLFFDLYVGWATPHADTKSLALPPCIVCVVATRCARVCVLLLRTHVQPGHTCTRLHLHPRYDPNGTGEVPKTSIISLLFATPEHYAVFNDPSSSFEGTSTPNLDLLLAELDKGGRGVVTREELRSGFRWAHHAHARMSPPASLTSVCLLSGNEQHLPLCALMVWANGGGVGCE